MKNKDNTYTQEKKYTIIIEKCDIEIGDILKYKGIELRLLYLRSELTFCFWLRNYYFLDFWSFYPRGKSNICDFVIYNIPQLAGVSLTMPLFKKMLENPRVIGVKNSSMPVQDIQMFKMEGGEDCIIFNGPDEQFISGRIIGAGGGIGGTYGVMPELFLKADELLKEGKITEACEIQHAIDKIIYAMCSCKCNMYAAAKQILREQGVECGSVRAPLAEITEEGIGLAHNVKVMIDEAIAKFVG